MKKAPFLLVKLYCFTLVSCLMVFGILHIQTRENLVQSSLVLPVWLVLYRDIFGRYPFQRRVQESLSFPYALLYGYSIIFSTLVIASLAFNVRSTLELVFTGIITPVPLYFLGRLGVGLARRSQVRKSSRIEEGQIIGVRSSSGKSDYEVPNERRNFFRIITSVGIGGLVLYLIFPRRAEAAFFGSVPGAGTIALKDSNGTPIDPAVNSPTDGYAISNVDSTAYPYYYGFINKDAAWYIMRENPENTFTYSKGSTDFATNWTGRAGLTYGTFDTIF